MSLLRSCVCNKAPLLSPNYFVVVFESSISIFTTFLVLFVNLIIIGLNWNNYRRFASCILLRFRRAVVATITLVISKVKVECSRGAKIKDIHEKANEFLASGQIDGNLALIVRCGKNDLAVGNEDTVATELRTLINDLKPKTKLLAISAVTLRNDSAALTAHKINRFTKAICE